MLGQATDTLDYLTHHGPDSGEATTFPHIVFSASHRGGYIRMALFPGTPKLESRNCPVGVLGLWMATVLRPDLGLGRVLNQSCSSCQKLSNVMSHSLRRRWEEVDSRLFVVGSQTSNLTPGPSFAHNLGCKCPNGQCEAILNIYFLRPFQ